MRQWLKVTFGACRVSGFITMTDAMSGRWTADTADSSSSASVKTQLWKVQLLPPSIATAATVCRSFGWSGRSLK